MTHSVHDLFGSSAFTLCLFYLFFLFLSRTLSPVYFARNYTIDVNRTVYVFSYPDSPQILSFEKAHSVISNHTFDFTFQVLLEPFLLDGCMTLKL